jgi:putative ABC transport system permease protein
VNLLQTFRVALRALLRNKLRSILTTLGIVIGTGAVIAMVAIGEGARAQVESAFQSMGTDLLVVMSGSSSMGGMRGGFGSQPTLTWDDLRAIQTELPSVRAAAPQLRTTSTVLAEGLNWTTQVYGTTPDYFIVRNWPVALGRMLQGSDVDGGTKVVVAGKTVVEQLFGSAEAAVGRTIRMKGVPYEVVGVAASKGQSPMGQDLDDVLFIPSTTFQAKVQGGPQPTIAGQIYVAASDPSLSARAQRDVQALLRERHRLGVDEADDFHIRNLAEIASGQQESTQTLSLLLASIAAVSLLVGGIGIMNIMLVSVTERTREIGIRMAVGARPVDVLLQFLVESLTLSLVGGLLGVAIGLFAAWALTARFGWPTVIRSDIVAIAISFSAGVGVGFGLYPAKKAAALDPIQALRYE